MVKGKATIQILLLVLTNIINTKVCLFVTLSHPKTAEPILMNALRYIETQETVIGTSPGINLKVAS